MEPTQPDVMENFLYFLLCGDFCPTVRVFVSGEKGFPLSTTCLLLRHVFLQALHSLVVGGGLITAGIMNIFVILDTVLISDNLDTFFSCICRGTSI